MKYSHNLSILASQIIDGKEMAKKGWWNIDWKLLANRGNSFAHLPASKIVLALICNRMQNLAKSNLNFAQRSDNYTQKTLVFFSIFTARTKIAQMDEIFGRY